MDMIVFPCNVDSHLLRNKEIINCVHAMFFDVVDVIDLHFFSFLRCYAKTWEGYLECQI